MTMDFDPQQKEAVNRTGTNILVSASAGAGKTRVLVSRLLKRCTEDGIPLERILALTFTEAAAGEMKKRLAQELNNRYQAETDPAAKDWLNHQIIALENASITTIDSYCLSIIQKYCNVIGLDPAVARSVLDEGTREIFLQNAFTDTVQTYIDKDPETMFRLLRLLSFRSEDYSALYNSVKSVNNFAQASVEPDVWYAEAESFYTVVRSFSSFPAPILDAFFGYLMLGCRELSALAAQMMESGSTDEKVNTDALAYAMNRIRTCITHLQDHEYVRYCDALKSLAVIKTSAGKDETYKAARKKYEDKIKAMLEICYDETVWVRDANAVSDAAVLLIRLSRDTFCSFQKIKLEHTCMDFGDMERFAWDILQKENGLVAGMIRDSFDEIMVDEFQDTSILQDAIIRAISRGNNIFRVGDVKQSIYGFRQAKPSLMRDLMNEEGTCHITLQHNYRSKNSIVEFSNLLFGKIMNIEDFEDHYRNEDVVSIGTEKQKELPVPVVFAVLQDKETEEDGEEESIGAKQAKAEWIASRILRMKQENPELHYRDFAVLLRSHQDKSCLKNAFTRCGIPYDIDARTGFYRSPLCQTILSAAKCVLYPDDMISLLSVLTSEMYNISDEEIAQMKIRHGSLKKGVLQEHPEVYRDIAYLRETATSGSPVDFLAAAADLNQFFNRLDHAQKANFDFLFEKTVQAHYTDLFTFIENIEAVKDEKSSEAMSIGRDDDVVGVTTIHHSKGLQYPIVFLWSTSRNSLQSKKDPVMIDDRLKLGMYFIDEKTNLKRPLIHRIAVEYAVNKADLEESIRLLYVAVTRAADRLFIVDHIKKDFLPAAADMVLMNARRGTTGMILPVLQEGPLFHVEYPEYEQIGLPAFPPVPENRELPSFRIQVKRYDPVITPSSSEIRGLPDLNLKALSGGTDYGTKMHSVIEQLPDTVWTDEDLEPYDLSDNEKAHLLAFAGSDIYHQALQMDIHKEYPFYIVKDQKQISGIMDFIAVGKDSVILTDFKTDHAEQDVLLNRYTDQLRMYRSAAETMYPGKQISVYIYSLYLDRFIEIPFS
ncbi:MAG: UvrD-helicase domain-containing protein [Solobacterium sp.]|nr:UvrD-helicase domain-containing protein [Solobacterium sp.]